MTDAPPVVSAREADAHREAGWWADETIADAVDAHAEQQPERAAYQGPDPVTWTELADATRRLGAQLVDLGVEPGARVAVWFPDGPLVHLALLAVERAGCTAVGVGARSGRREVVHLLRRTGARVVLTDARRADDAQRAVGAVAPDGTPPLVVTLEGPAAAPRAAVGGERLPAGDATALAGRRTGADDVFLINTTSGTTGLPKCVVHTQNRWRYFHQKAVAHGALTSEDVVLAAVPAPFGFGLWTSHVTPLLLGAPTVLLERFTPEQAGAAIERERVTVLCCVSTQFIMMLTTPGLEDHDLSSLRVMFTGGEAVPYERARAFEEATGATILQFYGSNETGLLSGTTLDDPPDRRLRTAGRVVSEMQVRLFDDGEDVTASGRGQPGCRGPATSLGYLDDDEANAELLTDDGWMLMGDIVEVDEDGYLTVVGRTSDLIIRGGKNISAAQVEADVATHPEVAQVAVVAMPDPVFGERACAYVEVVAGASLELADLVRHLVASGVSKELLPERLVVVDELPRSSGAKVAKGELRADIRRRLEAEAAAQGPARTREGAR
ncbi:class I adenylate-forming enzyme family protein [Iamia majanohamensis]|uniref:Class I adenylate-forming enzyme family protein n=1 Tax=Iamia majanohamensis TaxID=467976 RepID=A0AAE9Y6W8_9ACTN|nr:class I adenylate-forming enzyme family protein [Iamia majanohamensis]WCO67819.1 class I adenylate-forming enzyme family protein [Iamia majanohamensis]